MIATIIDQRERDNSRMEREMQMIKCAFTISLSNDMHMHSYQGNNNHDNPTHTQEQYNCHDIKSEMQSNVSINLYKLLIMILSRHNPFISERNPSNNHAHTP